MKICIESTGQGFQVYTEDPQEEHAEENQSQGMQGQGEQDMQDESGLQGDPGMDGEQDSQGMDTDGETPPDAQMASSVIEALKIAKTLLEDAQSASKMEGEDQFLAGFNEG